MVHQFCRTLLATALIGGLSACGESGGDNAAPSTSSASAAAGSVSAAELAALRDRVARLRTEVERLQDFNDIKRLQRTYGFYLDEAMWDDLADLFADDGSIEIALDGVYSGKSRVRDYLYALGGGHSGNAEGSLNEHFQLMPVVNVSEDGTTAKGRWRAIIMGGDYGGTAIWGEGPYENEYVKEDGVWKLKTVHWYDSMMVPYEGGWAKNKDVTGGKFVSGVLPPDAPSTVQYDTWPGVYLPPFHFKNPVTGE
ncbi:MAG: nuclear transport factor 2 family protein [Gammaproteobacteria bacterium]|nr:nuclear transport factor 2 family protein [Gammaproteobacteria bacterium]